MRDYERNWQIPVAGFILRVVTLAVLGVAIGYGIGRLIDCLLRL